MFVLIVLFLAAAMPLRAAAGSNVDRLVRTLDSLSLLSFNGWKVSPDLRVFKNEGDPSQPGYDDSRWDQLNIGDSVYPDSCWIRKEIVLPAQVLGRPLSGPIRFLVSVDDYGTLWVNGVNRGLFPWDGDFELTKEARPGERFTIAIRAVNTGGPLRLLRAELRPESVSRLRTTLHDFGVSLLVGQKLVGFDTYQTNARKKEDPGTDLSRMDPQEKRRLGEILQDAAARVDVAALGEGDMERFTASLEAARSRLAPVREFAKRFTITLDANAHIDAAWLWRDKETVEVCRNTFSSVLNMMDVRPGFTYTQSSAAYYDWMERVAPEVFSGIRRRVNEGRWEVVGGMWVEPDCNLPGGESWSRHLLYAKRYFRLKTGAAVTIGWNPDSFGYNWNMPMIYAAAGIDAFVTQKIGWNEENVFPHRVFWWESPDGSRVFSYFPFDYVNTIDDPFRLVDWLRQFEANTGFTNMMILFGVGDHGGGPSLDMLDRIDRLDSLDIYPKIDYATAGRYIGWLKSQDLSRVPVWKDELYLEYHQGTYTTQAAMKEKNRKCETLLTNAETFSAVASLAGRPVDARRMEDAWRNVLFNQFHDILPGSGIRENYIDAREKYDVSEEIGTHELASSLAGIAGRVSTRRAGKGRPFVVFNPLSWERTDIASVEVPDGEGSDLGVFDPGGAEIPSQAVERGPYRRELIFLARAVPAVGYRTFQLLPRKGPRPAVPRTAQGASIENEYFTVAVDEATGWVRSILDKRNGKEVLAGAGNELQLLEDKPSAWDAWNIGLTGVRYPSTLRSVEVAERGPVRQVIRVVRDYLKPGVRKDFPTEDFPSSFFVQEIILTGGIDRVDFRTSVDWWEDKTMLKVAFPVSVEDSFATYEIPFGSIRRSTRMDDRWQKAKVEVPALRWADLSHGEYGVSLLNRSKYGYDVKGNVLRLSLLRSPKWPDAAADRGKHVIEYALAPHAGSWQEAGTVRKGREYNSPLLVAQTGVHGGTLRENGSFLSVEPANIVLTTVKKAEDSDAWIVQWYEAAGVDSRAELRLPSAPARAMMSNILEEDGEALAPVKNRLSVPTPKHSLVTVKIIF